MKGMVKFYNKDKGFGFVVGENNQEYYFNHKAIAYGELPAAGCYCEFEPDAQTNNNDKKAEIKTLKVITQTVATQATTVTPNPTPRQYPAYYRRRKPQQVEVVNQSQSTLDWLIETHLMFYAILLGIGMILFIIAGVIDFFTNPIAFISAPDKMIITGVLVLLVGLIIFFMKRAR